MKSRARITSRENIVTNAKIELLGPGSEYADISRCVTGVTVDLQVGAASRAHIDVITCEAETEVILFSDETLAAFADTLSFFGWTVTPPESAEELAA